MKHLATLTIALIVAGAQAEPVRDVVTQRRAERAVARQLLDPRSARFESVGTYHTREYGTVACGLVSGRNRLGGYAGLRRFVSDGRSVILQGRDDLAGAWREACR